MNLKKITKVAIFIDYDNFAISYSKRFSMIEEDIKIWNIVTNKFLKYYQENFIENDFEVIEHVGSFLCVGISEYIKYQSEEMHRKEWFQQLDRKPGFIVKYGSRTKPYRNNAGVFRLGKEKGVDAEIICQMLMGAFNNHYDACILLSDDTDYLPVIRRVQDYFGKKVIQAGYNSQSRLRNQSYAHIPLEEANENLDFQNATY